MNVWVLAARQGPPVEVDAWTPVPVPYLFLFSWAMGWTRTLCRMDQGEGTKPHGPHPAGSKKEGTCGLLLLCRGLTSRGGMRSEDFVTQRKGHLLHTCTQ